jgi:hypothetical protein
MVEYQNRTVYRMVLTYQQKELFKFNSYYYIHMLEKQNSDNSPHPIH